MHRHEHLSVRHLGIMETDPEFARNLPDLFPPFQLPQQPAKPPSVHGTRSRMGVSKQSHVFFSNKNCAFHQCHATPLVHCWTSSASELLSSSIWSQGVRARRVWLAETHNILSLLTLHPTTISSRNWKSNNQWKIVVRKYPKSISWARTASWTFTNAPPPPFTPLDELRQRITFVLHLVSRCPCKGVWLAQTDRALSTSYLLFGVWLLVSNSVWQHLPTALVFIEHMSSIY